MLLTNLNIIGGGLHMKKVFITIVISSIFCVLTILSAEEKEITGDGFLRINDNIQNEDLRTELAELKEAFNRERTRIHEYYNEKIEALKKAQRGEIKTIKKDFAGRREILMKKYKGKIQKKSQIQTPTQVKKTPDKKKISPKEKKRKWKSN